MSVFVILSILQVGCGGDSQSETKHEEPFVVPVEVASVTTGSIYATFSGTATLEAEEETEVVAKVSGVVEDIYVEEGDRVSAGQILAKLDDEKFRVQLEQASSNLQKLQNEYRRNEALFKKNLISAEAFQRAKFEYEYQKATFELVKLDMEYTDIRTPIGGVIANRLIKVGNMVPSHQATFCVTGLDPLLAVLHVPEQQVSKLQPGHPARIRVDALDAENIEGSIERISPVVDPSTGTVKVTVIVQAEEHRLKPGMFTRVDIIHDSHPDATLVPKDAVIAEDNSSMVYVVNDSLAYRRMVRTGFVNTTHIEILEGLKSGELVVTTGKSSLKDSTRVERIDMSSEHLASR